MRVLTPVPFLRAVRLWSSKKPVLDFAIVHVACATPSDSSLSPLVLRLLMVSQAWW
jgi:hypothetical protein